MRFGVLQLQTYWINDKSVNHTGSTVSDETGETNLGNERRDADVDLVQRYSDKTLRLIDWNTEVFIQLLKKVFARRAVSGRLAETGSLEFTLPVGVTPLEEVAEIISFPDVDIAELEADKVTLPEAVVEQMRCYVSSIAAMYV